MSNRQVNYDRIAPSYNRRYASGGQQGVAITLRELARALGAGRILEVGCGTGHWLARLEAVSGQLYGLDLSAGMLAQAQQQEESLALVRGRAGQIPFPDASIDLLCCVNAIHHFQQQSGFVAEARRVLRPGGTLAVIGMDPRAHRHRWYVYEYFAGTYQTDLTRFPSWGTVLDWMVASGFQQVEWRIVEQIRDHKVGRSVFADPYLQKDAVSQLTILSDGAYAAGLACIETALAAAEATGETLTFPTDLLLAMLAGRVPE
ncbi:MAG: class I SAM-dependent methyltransferase [Anaerolineae bacterium]|jgi:ubiquinone/menaquinone biosynthesis C-methylase UbiE